MDLGTSVPVNRGNFLPSKKLTSVKNHGAYPANERANILRPTQLSPSAHSSSPAVRVWGLRQTARSPAHVPIGG